MPFTEEFTDGLNGWEPGLRYRTGEDREPENPPAGDGEYSDQYGGSVRLRVDGGPSTIGIGRRLTGLPAGTTVAVTYQVDAAAPQPGKIGTPVFAPDGDDMAETWVARNDGEVDPGERTITGTVKQSYPANTQLRVTADVWPGEFTAYITRIEAHPPDTTSRRFSFEQASAGDPLPAGGWYLMADEGGVHRIASDRSTDGSQSLHLRGGSGLGETRVAIDLDFTPLHEIRFDGYPVRNATSAGDIKVQVDDTDGKIGGLTQAATGRWHRDVGGENQVAEFSGEHTLILRTRGDGNEAFFDNIRLFDGSGSLIPPSQVVKTA